MTHIHCSSKFPSCGKEALMGEVLSCFSELDPSNQRLFIPPLSFECGFCSPSLFPVAAQGYSGAETICTVYVTDPS